MAEADRRVTEILMGTFQRELYFIPTHLTDFAQDLSPLLPHGNTIEQADHTTTMAFAAYSVGTDITGTATTYGKSSMTLENATVSMFTVDDTHEVIAKVKVAGDGVAKQARAWRKKVQDKAYNALLTAAGANSSARTLGSRGSSAAAFSTASVKEMMGEFIDLRAELIEDGWDDGVVWPMLVSKEVYAEIAKYIALELNDTTFVRPVADAVGKGRVMELFGFRFYQEPEIPTTGTGANMCYTYHPGDGLQWAQRGPTLLMRPTEARPAMNYIMWGQVGASVFDNDKMAAYNARATS